MAKRALWFLWGLSASTIALAQDDIDISEPTISRGASWSTVTAKTVGEQTNALEAKAGWPAISATFLRGLTDRLDVGGRLSFTYAEEYLLGPPLPGFKAQAVLRVLFLEGDRVNLGLHVDPGLLFHFGRARTDVGLALPVGVVLGVPVGTTLNVAFAVDVPAWVRFGTVAALFVPILFGVGAEYYLDPSFALQLTARAGPSLGVTTGVVALAFEGRAGLAFRL